MATVSGMIRNKVERGRAGSFFRVSDYDGPRRAVESALSRLALAGDLVRVRRGLYWKGANSRFGAGRPRAKEVALQIADHRGTGPCGWSASHVLGLSTQVPPKLDLAVVGPPPSSIPGVRFHSRRNLERLKLNYLEVALLECLRDWPRSVEADWSALVERTVELTSEGKIRLDRVLSAAAGEFAPEVRKRMKMLHEVVSVHRPIGAI